MVLELKLMAVDRKEAFIRRDRGDQVEYRRIDVEPFETLVLRDNESLLFPVPATRPCACGMTLSPFHGCRGELPASLTSLVKLAIAAGRKFRGRPTPELLALRAALRTLETADPLSKPWGDL